MYQIKASVGVLLAWALVVPSCTSQDDNDTPVDMRAASSDVIRQPNPVLEPTRPEGGLVRGRVASLSAEENAERVARNKKEPIVWGESAAGISMTTEYLESLDILAEPLGTSQGFHFYNENVRIAWSSQGKRTPQSIIIDVGYQGVLQLPGEFGEVRLGESFKSRFPATDTLGKEFARALARAFEKMGSDFDCFSINVCRITEDPDFIEFSFRNGSVLFSNDNRRELRFVYFLPKLPQLTPPLTQPLVFGDSVGGVSMDMTIHQIKGILGNPAFISGAFTYFDNGNLAIAWDESSKPFMFFIDRGYQGTWEVPGMGSWRLNNEMVSHFEGDHSGVTLLKKLGRIFDGKTAPAFDGYDCQLVNSCRAILSTDGTELTFEFDKGALVFDNTPEKRLASMYYTRPKPARTEPMTADLNFPTGVANITLSMTQTEAMAALGQQPRRISGPAYYYDNDNVIILWKNEAPNNPIFIQINKGYRGSVKLPGGLDVNMGANMTAQLDVKEDTIKAWGRSFLGKDVSYDCLADKTCAIDDEDETLHYFFFEGLGFFVFGAEAKDLRYVVFDPTQVVE